MRHKLKYFYFLGLTFAYFLSYTQNIDSLVALLPSLKEDTAAALVLNTLSFQLKTENPEEAKKYAQRALVLSEKLKFRKGLGSSINNLGIIHYLSGNYAEALAYYTKAVALYKEMKDKHREANVLNNMGLTYSKMGNYALSTNYYLQSLNLKEEEGDQLGMARTYINVSNNYIALGQWTQSLKYAELAYKKYEPLADEEGCAKSLNNIGAAWYQWGDKGKALEYYLRSLAIRKKMNDKQELASTYNNIGMIYSDNANYAAAEDFLSRSLQLREESGNKEEIAESNNNLGYLYLRKKQYDKALWFLEKARELAAGINAIHELQASHEYLSHYYELTGNAVKALDHLKIFLALKDSLSNERITQQMNSLQSEFQLQVKDKELIKKEAELQRQQDQARQKATERNAFIAGFLLMVALAFFIFRGYSLQKKARLEIMEQKNIIETKNKDILDSINYAQRIQRSFLPPEKEFSDTFSDYFNLFMPKDVVSGDFYWLVNVHTTPQKGEFRPLAVLSVVDCTGHGVPGALMSIVGNTLLNQTIKNPHINSPAEALDFLNKELPKNLKKQSENDRIRDGMDMAMCAIDFNSDKLYFAGANHNLYRIRNECVTEIPGDKQAISGSDDIPKTNFTNHAIDFIKGDCFYMFSDGYADQFGGPKGKKFKRKQLVELLRSMQSLSMPQQKEKLRSVFEDWKGKLEQVDDVCFVGIKL